MSFYTSIFKAFGSPLRRMIGPILRPVTRILMGAIAIPIFRFILTKIFRLKEIDDELEKDLEQWFRGSMLLLAATANMEHLFFFWLGFDDPGAGGGLHHNWFSTCLRLLLAIGVVEAMPDQELFAVIHPGPPPIRPHRGVFREVWKKKKLIAKGLICQHLNRLSPVMAIMCAIFGGRYSTEPEQYERWLVGWVCYGLAIFQYLIIGLVTSRDRALDVLSEFDRAVAKRRRDLIKEFDIKEEPEPIEEKQRWWSRRRWKRWRQRITGSAEAKEAAAAEAAGTMAVDSVAAIAASPAVGENRTQDGDGISPAAVEPRADAESTADEGTQPNE
ncbi:DNA topoisomerase I [bacterium]|nr:DNA topoisomerase I [bacterium]